LENQNVKNTGIDVSHKTVTMAINREGRIGYPVSSRTPLSGPDPGPAQGSGEPGRNTCTQQTRVLSRRFYTPTETTADFSDHT